LKVNKLNNIDITNQRFKKCVINKKNIYYGHKQRLENNEEYRIIIIDYNIMTIIKITNFIKIILYSYIAYYVSFV